MLTARQRVNFNAKCAPQDDRGCVLWTGYKNADGYGKFRLNGESVPAHRVSYEITAGPIPDGMLVLHSCDVPSCVAPAHLRLGTDTDNGVDKARRKRAPTKLSDDEVRKIRAASGRYRDIADTFKISPAMVCLLKQGTRRTHVEN